MDKSLELKLVQVLLATTATHFYSLLVWCKVLCRALGMGILTSSFVRVIPNTTLAILIRFPMISCR